MPTKLGYWPCPPDYPIRIESYQGYDYLGLSLASHGFIVASISANGINAQTATGDPQQDQWRAELIHEHLRYWSNWNSVGGCPFGNLFVGKVDLQKVGLMGHSRGAEGIVSEIHNNRRHGSPYGIKGVLPFAAKDEHRLTTNGIPLGVVLPYCDAIAPTLDGVQYFDDARHNDPAPRHSFLTLGANHNYYNTIWSNRPPEGNGDDWDLFFGSDGPDAHCAINSLERLSADRQRASLIPYANAFFGTYLPEPLQGDYLPYLTGDAGPPDSAQGARIYVSYTAPQGSSSRRDLNRLMDESELQINTLGGNVTPVALTPYELCGRDESARPHCLPIPPYENPYKISQEPHTWVNAPPNAPPAQIPQLDSGWNSTPTGRYINELPPGQRDVSGFEALQFRASINFSDSRNPAGVAQNFTVVLADGSGRQVSVAVQEVYGNRPYPLYYPPGSGPHAGTTPTIDVPVPKIILNMVRIRLSEFTARNPDLNLTDISSVEFRYDQQSSGRLLFSDIAFANSPASGGPPPPPATPTPTHCPIEFEDVPPTVGRMTPTPIGYTRYYDNIRCLACRLVISGSYGIQGRDNPCTGSPEDPSLTYFYPCVPITRGQVAKFVSNAAGFYDEIPDDQQSFIDVPKSHPFWLWIERLAWRNIVSGYEGVVQCPAGSPCYRPSDAATRAQVMKMVALAAGLNDEVTGQTFADVPPTHPFYLYIERVKLRGGIAPYMPTQCVKGKNAPINPCTGLPESCDDQCRPYLRPCLPMQRDEATKPNAAIFYPHCYSPLEEGGIAGCEPLQGANPMLTVTPTGTGTVMPTNTGTPMGTPAGSATAPVSVTETAPIPSPTATSWVPTPVQTAPPPVPTEQQRATIMVPRR